jgi:hypothetical protein
MAPRPRPTKDNLPPEPAPSRITRSSGRVAATNNKKTTAKAAAESKSSLRIRGGELPHLTLTRGLQEKDVRCPCGKGEQTRK